MISITKFFISKYIYMHCISQLYCTQQWTVYILMLYNAIFTSIHEGQQLDKSAKWDWDKDAPSLFIPAGVDQLYITLQPTQERRVSHSNMTSSNGSFFRITGPLCGEFIGHRRIPLTKDQ